MIHRCPQHLFDKIINGDEAGKRAARQEVIDWLVAQNLTAGDDVIVPDPSTGEEMMLRKGIRKS